MLENSESLPVSEKIITPTCASHNIDNSFAFFNNPFLLFEYVTFLLVGSSILLMAIFPLPISLRSRSLKNFRVFLILREYRLRSWYDEAKYWCKCVTYYIGKNNINILSSGNYSRSCLIYIVHYICGDIQGVNLIRRE